MKNFPIFRRDRWCALVFSLVASLFLSSCSLFDWKRGRGDDDKRVQAESLGEYQLEPGSMVALEMFEGGASTLVADVEVDVDGDLSIPGVGEVSVDGMNPLAAAKKIEFLARRSGQNHLGGPRAHIKALDRRAVVHVSGHVGRSGPVTFAPGLTVEGAIDAAGGTTPDANSRSIGLTTEGRKMIVTTPETSELKEGDVVNVPRRL